MNNGNVLTVSMTDDTKIEIIVLDIIEMIDKEKKYIIYSLNNNLSDDIYISILHEDENTYKLETIEDEEELKSIEEYLKELNES